LRRDNAGTRRRMRGKKKKNVRTKKDPMILVKKIKIITELEKTTGGGKGVWGSTRNKKGRQGRMRKRKPQGNQTFTKAVEAKWGGRY